MSSGNSSDALRAQPALVSDQAASRLAPSGFDQAQGGWSAEVQHGPDGEQNYAWVKAADGELICVVKTHHAHLIAAAADLLETLRWYADTFCELGPYIEPCGKLDSDQCSGCRARAAIAKHLRASVPERMGV